MSLYFFHKRILLNDNLYQVKCLQLIHDVLYNDLLLNLDIKNQRGLITNIKNPTKTIRDHYPMINFTVDNSKIIGITRHKLLCVQKYKINSTTLYTNIQISRFNRTESNTAI